MFDKCSLNIRLEKMVAKHRMKDKTIDIQEQATNLYAWRKMWHKSKNTI